MGRKVHCCADLAREAVLFSSVFLKSFGAAVPLALRREEGRKPNGGKEGGREGSKQGRQVVPGPGPGPPVLLAPWSATLT